jgi:hypothetical protein
MKPNMTFLESISIGINKAMLETKNIESIKQIFEELNLDLEKHSNNFKIAIKKSTEQCMDSRISGVNFNSNTKSSLHLCHKFGIETYAELATFQHTSTGFPCVLHFDENDYPCENLQELRRALISLLSSASFGRAIMSGLRS